MGFVIALDGQNANHFESLFARSAPRLDGQSLPATLLKHFGFGHGRDRQTFHGAAEILTHFK